MNWISIYAAIGSIVFFGSDIVSYTPEIKPAQSVVGLTNARPITPPELEQKTKTYKKNEQLSPKKLKAILYEAGFRGQRLREAWGTAMKESTGRPRSHNKNSKTGDNSYGLFQINMIGDLGPARRKQFNLNSNKDLFDPVRNAKIAFFMSNGGKNWSSWNGITDTTKKWMKQFPKG